MQHRFAVRSIVALTIVLAGCSGAANPALSARTSGARAAQALALTATIYSWGLGGVGQLGDGSFANSDVPVKVKSVAGVSAIGGGGAHSLLVTSGGSVYAWGWNKFGELGVGNTTGPQQCPLGKMKTACSTAPVQVPGLSGISTVAGGDIHSLALAPDGTVWAWGNNQYGEIGNGTVTTTGCLCIDAPVRALVPSNIVAVGGGGRHSIALRSDGTVWAWGLNNYGQLGDGTMTDRSTPVQVKGLTNVVEISAGYYHNLAVTKGGTVYAWGRNAFGQLGDGNTTNSDVPVQVTGLTGVTAVRGGGEFSLAMRNDGTVWSWGENTYGELGNGTLTNSSVPVQVTGLAGATAIGAGHRHGLAADASGALWAWGQNTYGELGNGTKVDSDVPVRVKNLTGPKTFGAGDQFSLAFHR